MNNKESSKNCQNAQISQIDTKSNNFKIDETTGMATWKIGDDLTKSVDKDQYCLEYFGDLDMPEDAMESNAGYFKLIT